MGFKDTIGSRDGVNVEVGRDPQTPEHPCPACGSETKPRDDGARGCLGCSLVYYLDGGKAFRRVGECTRCGECCKTGDPFAPREPRQVRERPCSYYRSCYRERVGECAARSMANPPERVRRYLVMACTPFPTRPRCLRSYPRCGYHFEEVGDDG